MLAHLLMMTRGRDSWCLTKLASTKTMRLLFSLVLVKCDVKEHATIFPLMLLFKLHLADCGKEKPLMTSQLSDLRLIWIITCFLFQNCRSTIYLARWIWECSGKLAVISVKRTCICNGWLLIILLKTKISIMSAHTLLCFSFFGCHAYNAYDSNVVDAKLIVETSCWAM